MNFLDSLYIALFFIFIGYVIGMKHHEYMMKRKINRYVTAQQTTYHHVESILADINDKEKLQEYIENLKRGDENERH